MHNLVDYFFFARDRRYKIGVAFCWSIATEEMKTSHIVVFGSYKLLHTSPR